MEFSSRFLSQNSWNCFTNSFRCFSCMLTKNHPLTFSISFSRHLPLISPYSSTKTTKKQKKDKRSERKKEKFKKRKFQNDTKKQRKGITKISMNIKNVLYTFFLFFEKLFSLFFCMVKETRTKL